MRIQRRYEEEVETIQLAPLVDIVFVILIFFMTTSVFQTLESEVDITLPTAASAGPIARTQGEIIINIRNDNSIVLNNRKMNVEELQQVLYQVAENFPGGAVIIRCDGDAAFRNSMAVLDCCRNADIQNVSFAAIKEESRRTP